MLFFGKSKAKKCFISPPVLETPRLKLRKIVPGDAEDMFEYSHDPETSKYLLWEKHRNINVTKEHIAILQKEYARAEFYDWGIEYLENGKFIGTVGFTTIDDKTNSAQVGYVLSPKYHRMGIAPEALSRIMEFGFSYLGFSALYARFMEDNTASRKVLIKCGFTECENHEDAIYKHGKKQNIIKFSITKEQFIKIKGA